MNAGIVALGQQRRRIGDGVEQRLEPDLLGLVEVGQHMADHPVLVARVADADPHPLELARAQTGVGAAQAVVAGDAAAQLDPDLAGGEVDLVVEDDDVGRAAA